MHSVNDSFLVNFHITLKLDIYPVICLRCSRRKTLHHLADSRVSLFVFPLNLLDLHLHHIDLVFEVSLCSTV